MKWLTLLLTFIIFVLPTAAQTISDDCPASVEHARNLLADVDVALTEARYQDAETLLRDARQLISRSCGDTTLSIGGNSNLDENTRIVPPSTNPSGQVASVRVVNTVADSTNDYNLTLKDTGDFVTGLGYGEFTGLIPVPAGTRTFNGLTWDFPSNSTWVLAITGLNETASVQVQPISILRNNLQGKARVRVVQTISGLERVSITSVEGVTFGEGLGWLGNQDIEIEPGDYTLRADTTGGTQVIPNTDFTFESDQSYTIFLTGSKEGQSTPQFTSLESAQDTTRVRFINERPEVLEVFYRPANEKLIAELATGATSEWVNVPTSAVTFIAYEIETGPRGQEKASLSEALRSGRDLTITIEADGSMTVETIAFTQ